MSIRQALYWLSHTPAQQVWFAFQIIRGCECAHSCATGLTGRSDDSFWGSVLSFYHGICGSELDYQTCAANALTS